MQRGKSSRREITIGLRGTTCTPTPNPGAPPRRALASLRSSQRRVPPGALVDDALAQQPVQSALESRRRAATGRLVYGDKEKPELTKMFNDGHHVDIGITGNPDTCLEVKVASPLTVTHHAGGGAHPPDVGDRFGFGNTEEYYRIMTLGCKASGIPKN